MACKNNDSGLTIASFSPLFCCFRIYKRLQFYRHLYPFVLKFFKRNICVYLFGSVPLNPYNYKV